MIMRMLKAPTFWQQKYHPLALLLWPLGWLYKIITAYRLHCRRTEKLSIPIICVGNITVGGVGKTPIVQDFVSRLQAMGKKPHIILRGYGSANHMNRQVDVAAHDVHDVGDEALLHAVIAPTWVGRNRMQSARMAMAAGADVIVMDDGLQNTTITPSYVLLVVDAARGLGNGYGLPAGPLREDFVSAISRIDAIVMMGGGDAGLPPHNKTILRASVETNGSALRDLEGRPAFVFAGIGAPERFRTSLQALGLDIVGMRSFADHHLYQEKEILALKKRAALLGAVLVTTQKDLVRIPDNLRSDIIAVDAHLQWQDSAAVDFLLREAVGDA